jgi:hypothetical protein
MNDRVGWKPDRDPVAVGCDAGAPDSEIVSSVCEKTLGVIQERPVRGRPVVIRHRDNTCCSQRRKNCRVVTDGHW